MKHRRELGPKRQPNRPALFRFLLYAGLAALAGSALAYLAYRLGVSRRPADPRQQGSTFLQLLPVMIVAATVLTILGLLFFGLRAYLSGVKARHSLQSSRMKIRRPQG